MTFESDGQFITASFCALLGVICGIAVFVVNSACCRFGKKFFVIRCVLIAFINVFTAAAYVYVSVKYKFPNFRAYMPICFGTGIAVSYKTLSVTLAKARKKYYNKKVGTTRPE